MNGSIIPPTGNKRGADCSLFIGPSDGDIEVCEPTESGIQTFVGYLVSWVLDGERLTIDAVNDITGQVVKAEFNISHLAETKRDEFLDGLELGEEIKIHYEK